MDRRNFLGISGMTALGGTGIIGFRNKLLPFFQAGNRVQIDKNGIRIYNGPPALGNLVASFGAVANYVDAKGNVVQAGDVTYQGTTRSIQENNGSINFWTNGLTQIGAFINYDSLNNIIQIAPTNGLAKAAIVDGSNNNHGMLFDPVALQFLFGNDILTTGVHTAEIVEVHGNLAITGNVKAIQNNAEETWHNVTPFVGNFGVGGAQPQYQYEPINGGRLRFRGQIQATGANAAGATFFNPPYQFVTSGFFPAPSSAVFNSGFTVKALAGNPGAMQVVLATALGNQITLDGVVVPLD